MAQLVGSHSWKTDPRPVVAGGMVGMLVGAAVATAIAISAPGLLARVAGQPVDSIAAAQDRQVVLEQLQAHREREYARSFVAPSSAIDTRAQLQAHLAREYGAALRSRETVDVRAALHHDREYRSDASAFDAAATREAIVEHTLRENGGT